MELAECPANAEFQVVSAKQAPFAQIQNHVQSTFAKTFMNPPAYQQQIEQGKLSDLVGKRSYQSPLQVHNGKKSDISKRGVMPSPITQQHQSYFSNTAAQTGLRKSKGGRGGYFGDKK
jgi:hypothetical protein